MSFSECHAWLLRRQTGHLLLCARLIGEAQVWSAPWSASLISSRGKAGQGEDNGNAVLRGLWRKQQQQQQPRGSAFTLLKLRERAQHGRSPGAPALPWKPRGSAAASASGPGRGCGGQASNARPFCCSSAALGGKLSDRKTNREMLGVYSQRWTASCSTISMLDVWQPECSVMMLLFTDNSPLSSGTEVSPGLDIVTQVLQWSGVDANAASL